MAWESEMEDFMLTQNFLCVLAHCSWNPNVQVVPSLIINFFQQVMQLSDKSCELAEENDRLYDKNRDQMRKIQLLEAEQNELVS